MEQKILSICIPVYNRKEIFKHCLIKACEASLDFEKKVEIIISDNASEEDLLCLVEDVRLKYNLIDIIYHKNSYNIGLSKNFLKVVDIASGKYCWIIGSDDFIKSNGISTIIDIVRQNDDVNFISCNYDLILLNEVVKKNKNGVTDQFINLQNQLEDENILIPHKAPIWSRKVNKLDELIDPLFNNVLLGSVMAGIFKKVLWDNVDKSTVDWDGFNSFASMYPHCYIYANAFMGKKAFYCGKPLITVGEGTREWSTDIGNTFWESSLPVIYFSVFGEMVETYKKFGLEKKQYYKCRKWVANNAGNYLLPVIFRRYIFKKYIKDSNVLNVKQTLRLNILMPNFYKSIVISTVKNGLKCLLSNINKFYIRITRISM